MSSITQASASLAAAASQAASSDSALLAADAHFDADACLLWGKSSDNRYHTQLKPGTPIHPTRESAEYAASLLESAEPWRQERGAAIMAKLLQLQDKDPARRTFGIWSWYWEEPLPQMAPPDWNWADFLGTQLLRVLRCKAPDELPASLHAGMSDALKCAAESIRRRDVTLSYTNIAIMGTYVTLMAGHLLSDATMLSYARSRLRKFVAFTSDFGGFPEYNSPTYTAVAIAELTRMLRDFPTEEDRALVREVLHRAWSEVATHWHAPSRQWAGPHSRCYFTMLQPNILSFIQRGLGNRASAFGSNEPQTLPAPSLDWGDLPLHCPASLIHYFQDERPQSHIVAPLSAGRPAIDGHTHLTPEFALSSVERGSFWNQFRVVSAYAPGNKHATAFCMRFLHDGYDFCSLNVLTRQQGASLLGAACLAYDGGDKHPSLDKYPNARISAEDWRLRLVFIDPIDVEAFMSLKVEDSGTLWTIPFGTSATLHLRWLHLVFGGFTPKLEISQISADPDATGHQCLIVNIDFVFYIGPRREFIFDEHFTAAIAYGLAIKSSNETESVGTENISLALHQKHLELQWFKRDSQDAGPLQLCAPTIPRTEAEIIAFALNQKKTPTVADAASYPVKS